MSRKNHRGAVEVAVDALDKETQQLITRWLDKSGKQPGTPEYEQHKKKLVDMVLKLDEKSPNERVNISAKTLRYRGACYRQADYGELEDWGREPPWAEMTPEEYEGWQQSDKKKSPEQYIEPKDLSPEEVLHAVASLIQGGGDMEFVKKIVLSKALTTQSLQGALKYVQQLRDNALRPNDRRALVDRYVEEVTAYLSNK